MFPCPSCMPLYMLLQPQSPGGRLLLPDGLQHNTLSLMLSHNRIHDLDSQLTTHTHLSFLDLCQNQPSHLPAGLPSSLCHLHATFNRLQLLDKDDTVYQWKLRVLDLSSNKLERAYFINNTLINLCTLNLSCNHFWTLPSNMPAHLKMVDLSHNLLVKVLPGSLDRLLRLTHFYLHGNRFSTLTFGALDKLTLLSVISLGNNPWACHLSDDISYVLSWTKQTSARVLGCPCHTWPVRGGVHPGRTGGWHFASYNQSSLAASAQDWSSMPPDASITEWWSQSVSSRLSIKEAWNTPHHYFIATVIPHSAGSDATQPAFHPDSHLTSGPVPGASVITPTAIRAQVTLATDQFSREPLRSNEEDNYSSHKKCEQAELASS